MENDLVIMKNLQAVTTSLNIAKKFEKQHKNVLRAIDSLKKDVPNFELIFSEGNEPDKYGRERRIYYMNRDGFTLVAMGFTGKEALKFKLEYIRAFNEMEEHIKAERHIQQPDYYKIGLQLKQVAQVNSIQAQTNENQARTIGSLKDAFSDKTYSPHIQVKSYYTSDLTKIGDFAHIFSKRHGVHLSGVRLFRYLRKRHILVAKKYTKNHKKNEFYNTPEQKYYRKGYFDVVRVTKGNKEFLVTLVTLKGQEWLDQLVKSNLERVLSPTM